LERKTFVKLAPFVRASALHIGAAAAASSLREELVGTRATSAADFDGAYAVARSTPGTNLLALYALLGHRLGGWSLALSAAAVGVLVPGTVAVLVAAYYVESTSSFFPLVMRGARAGGLAVFLGAVVRLSRPQLTEHRRLGLAFALVAFVAAWLFPMNQSFILLTAGALGAVVLKPTS
jgi:chromate transporter